MAKTLVECLRQMPHVAPDELLIRAVESLGLQVSPSASEHRVAFSDSTIAVIRDSRIELREMVLEQIAPLLNAVSGRQGKAFNKVLKEINPDKSPVHEAGHVVAAHIFGFSIRHARVGQIDEVSLTPREFIQDCLNFGNRREKKRLQEFFSAGVAAEQLIFKAKPLYGYCYDLSMVNRLETSRKPHPDFEDEGELFWSCVRRVQPKLPVVMIEAVAESLKQNGRLKGKDIKKLLGDMK